MSSRPDLCELGQFDFRYIFLLLWITNSILNEHHSICPQDHESLANHPDAVRLDDGSLRFRHKNKLETWDERTARIAHNQYVKFSRSFDSTSS